VPLPADGHFKWTAPRARGRGRLLFIRHVLPHSPTRNDNGDDGGATKDTLYTLIDYLDPVATRTFIKLIYETYEKASATSSEKPSSASAATKPTTRRHPVDSQAAQTFQAVKGYDFKPTSPDLRRQDDA